MAERVVLLPGWAMSPEACEHIRGYKALLEELRKHFEVNVFVWPAAEKIPRVPPTWQAAAGELRLELGQDCHLIAAGGNVTVAFMALDSSASVRSLVCDGIDVPRATLESLGMPELAAAVDARRMADRSQVQSSLALNQGASEEEIQRDTELVFANLDRGYLEAFGESFATIDLTQMERGLSIPTLYLEPDVSMAGYSDMQDIFRHLVPHATFESLSGWPSREHDPETGRKFAKQAIAFIEKVGGRTMVATVLFTDIVDSTVRALELGDRRWSELLAQHHALVRTELARHSGKEVDTAGDGFLATFESPARGVSCALAIIRAMNELGLDVRAGLHTGECVASGEKVTGIAVHLASRVAQRAVGGEVLVSDTVRQLLTGSHIEFEERGEHELKGLPGKWRLFAVSG